jgi:hypothetical protein
VAREVAQGRLDARDVREDARSLEKKTLGGDVDSPIARDGIGALVKARLPQREGEQGEDDALNLLGHDAPELVMVDQAGVDQHPSQALTIGLTAVKGQDEIVAADATETDEVLAELILFER